MHILAETGRLDAIPAARETLVSAHLEIAFQLDLVSADVTRAKNGPGMIHRPCVCGTEGKQLSLAACEVEGETDPKSLSPLAS